MDKLLKYLTKLKELRGAGINSQEAMDKEKVYISKINYYYDLVGGETSAEKKLKKMRNKAMEERKMATEARMMAEQAREVANKAEGTQEAKKAEMEAKKAEMKAKNAEMNIQNTDEAIRVAEADMETKRVAEVNKYNAKNADKKHRHRVAINKNFK